jgi:hypothetical protein
MAFTRTDPNSTGGRTVTKEEKQATIGALLEERRGYELRGEDDRVAQVDAQLKALGHEARKPAARAETRPSRKASSKR